MVIFAGPVSKPLFSSVRDLLQQADTALILFYDHAFPVVFRAVHLGADRVYLQGIARAWSEQGLQAVRFPDVPVQPEAGLSHMDSARTLIIL